MVRAGTVSERVYEALREEIISWRIPAGTALSEVDLAERLGVSRTPLRSALARLALEGLIDTSRGRTGFVADVSATSVAELFELREVLEVQAARLAARRRDPRVFTRLADDFAGAAAGLAGNGAAGYYDVSRRFDEAIDQAIGNRPFRAALAASRTHLVRARRLAADNPTRLLRAAEEHARICTAIADGDEELAAAATLLHLRVSLSTILATLASRIETRGTA